MEQNQSINDFLKVLSAKCLNDQDRYSMVSLAQVATTFAVAVHPSFSMMCLHNTAAAAVALFVIDWIITLTYLISSESVINHSSITLGIII